VEKKAVHGIFPDLAPLTAQLEGDPYSREAVAARIHFDAISGALALDRKKCVILDLDGILWPGVLAETGAPFAWSPETGSPYSYAGLYFGIHEALHSLKRRGVLLASASKNDEAVVRSLWTYDSHYPHDLLLHSDDLVTWRVNWDDKVDNILAIAEELGLALESILFIDDSPVERDRVRQRLPEVEVWGEDILGLRRRLLSDPRLQTTHLTPQSAERSELTKARLRRQAARSDAQSDEQFLTSLDIRIDFRRVTDDADLQRVAELFERTTQFNTTGKKYSLATLAALAAAPHSHVFAVRVEDRFGDHGLAGAAIVQADAIEIFALSCRVLGLGVEKEFLRLIVGALSQSRERLVARILPTARNNPVRNLYRDSGFSLLPDGLWCLSLSGSKAST
jgi:FkbH-like protein